MTPGFRADAIFGAAVNRAFIESAAAGGTISLGFVGRKSDGTITQGSVSLASQDNVAQAELSGVSSDDSWLSWPTVDSTTIDTQAQVTSITSTQFVSTLKTGTTAVPFGWLACNFNDTMYAEVKAIDPPVSAVSSATSGFSVAPVFGAILGTMLQAYDTGDNSGDSGVLMLGTFTGTGAQFAYEIQDEDESDPTDSDTVSDDAAVYLNDHTGASAFRGSLTSMDATGWTINYSAANGTQRKWVALAIGPAAGAGPSSPFLQSKKRFFLHGVRK
jgi:hypothetical protein